MEKTAVWEHANTPELAELERWGIELATRDRTAGIAALVKAAQYGFPKVIAAGGEALEGLGFTGEDSDPIHDGAAVEVQIARAAAWVADPSKANAAKVSEAFDPGRQLQVWEEDLHPTEETAYFWYHEIGQCLCAAIGKPAGKADGASYYEWPAAQSVGRGLVIAARGLCGPGANTAQVVKDLRAAIGAS